jgi:hypothetical protein
MANLWPNFQIYLRAGKQLAVMLDQGNAKNRLFLNLLLGCQGLYFYKT